MKTTRRRLIQAGAAGLVLAPSIVKAKTVPKSGPQIRAGSGGSGFAAAFDGGSWVSNPGTVATFPSQSSIATINFCFQIPAGAALGGMALLQGGQASTVSFASDHEIDVFLSQGSGGYIGFLLALYGAVNQTTQLTDSAYVAVDYAWPDDGAWHSGVVAIDGASLSVAGKFDGQNRGVRAGVNGANTLGVNWAGRPTWIGNGTYDQQTYFPMQGGLTEVQVYIGQYLDLNNPEVLAAFWDGDNGIPAEPGSWMLLGTAPDIYLTGSGPVFPTNWVQGTWEPTAYTDTNPPSSFDVQGNGLTTSPTDPWLIDATVMPRGVR